MASATYRLKVPAFDLSWYEYISPKDNLPYVYLLMPGGGGKAKSGVKNQIMLNRCHYDIHSKEKEFQFLDGHLTDAADLSALCNGISHGKVEGNTVALALVDAFCVVYQTSLDDETKVIKFVTKARFEADFDKEFASLNSSLVLSFGCIATGGDDTTVRIWNVDTSVTPANTWKVDKVFELKGHTAAITSLREHPTETWLCSAAKDGSCKIWDLKVGTLLVDVPFLLDGIPDFDPKKMKMECRGCSFSLDGSSLFSIQSPRKGSTYLVQWGIEKKVEEAVKSDKANTTKPANNGDPIADPADDLPKVSINVFYQRKKLIHKVPSTRLDMSENGKYIAVGASDGSVAVVTTEKLSEVKRVVCHDLPVTGLGFAPQHITAEKELLFMLGSCSADNKLNIIKLKAYSSFQRSFIIFILLLLVVLLFAITTGLHIELLSVFENYK